MGRSGHQPRPSQNDDKSRDARGSCGQEISAETLQTLRKLIPMLKSPL